MNHKTELKNLANAWNKYRKMQGKLIKVRKAKPHPDNIAKAKAIMEEINKHIAMMDQSTERIKKGFNQPKPGKIPPPASDQFVN